MSLSFSKTFSFWLVAFLLEIGCFHLKEFLSFFRVNHLPIPHPHRPRDHQYHQKTTNRTFINWSGHPPQAHHRSHSLHKTFALCFAVSRRLHLDYSRSFQRPQCRPGSRQTHGLVRQTCSYDYFTAELTPNSWATSDNQMQISIRFVFHQRALGSISKKSGSAIELSLVSSPDSSRSFLCR